MAISVVAGGALATLTPATASAASCQTWKNDTYNMAYAVCLGSDFDYYYAWATCLENDGNLYWTRGHYAYVENDTSVAVCHEYADVDAYGVEVIR
ncbi:hypothetical protein ACWDA3_47720 [Nonomuraea rubra]